MFNRTEETSEAAPWGYPRMGCLLGCLDWFELSCVCIDRNISEETYEETNTVPIAMSRQLEVDTIYSCAS